MNENGRMENVAGPSFWLLNSPFFPWFPHGFPMVSPWPVVGALCTAPLNVNPFAAPSYGYCQCQGGRRSRGPREGRERERNHGKTKGKPWETHLVILMFVSHLMLA